MLSHRLPVCGTTAIDSTPTAAMIAVVHDTLASHAGFGWIPNSTTDPHATRTTASTILSASAVVSTYGLLRLDWLLMIQLRTSSPALAGRKLFPKYPAMFAE